MQIRRVMLVDDEDDIRTIAELSLSAVGGLETVLAASGDEALEMALEQRPDVILLDVLMPGMDGPTLFRHLQANPSTATIPVIFMTARVQRREVERYLALGVAGVVPKPFDPMTLAATVREIVSNLAGKP